MEFIKRYIQQNWLLLFLFILIPFVGYINGNREAIELIVPVVLIFFILPALQFLFVKVLKVEKRGPIPWYGNPLLWMAIFLGIIYGFFVL